MRIISLAKTGSTNEVAKGLAARGDTGPLWVKAAVQTMGRGRRGREWKSPSGNLFCTGLYPYNGTLSEAALLSFVAALAVHDLASVHVKCPKITLKWPNDVLIDGAKTSGILLESGTTQGQSWVAVGIGVNLISHPENTGYPATHINDHIATRGTNKTETPIVDADAALAILATQFDCWRDIYNQNGFAPIREAWMSNAHNIPGDVKVQLPKESFSGHAIGLGENGELQVRLQGGSIRNVHAGDVFFEE